MKDNCYGALVILLFLALLFAHAGQAEADRCHAVLGRCEDEARHQCAQLCNAHPSGLVRDKDGSMRDCREVGDACKQRAYESCNERYHTCVQEELANARRSAPPLPLAPSLSLTPNGDMDLDELARRAQTGNPDYDRAFQRYIAELKTCQNQFTDEALRNAARGILETAPELKGEWETEEMGEHPAADTSTSDWHRLEQAMRNTWEGYKNDKALIQEVPVDQLQNWNDYLSENRASGRSLEEKVESGFKTVDVNSHFSRNPLSRWMGDTQIPTIKNVSAQMTNWWLSIMDQFYTEMNQVGPSGQLFPTGSQGK